jgi:hypothetical protein
MVWHARPEHDPTHRWLRDMIRTAAREITTGTTRRGRSSALRGRLLRTGATVHFGGDSRIDVMAAPVGSR